MAWLSSNSHTSGSLITHTMFNNLANDIRNWGGNVNAGGYSLSNIGSLMFPNGDVISGIAGFQTPWKADVNAAGFGLYGAKSVAITTLNASPGMYLTAFPLPSAQFSRSQFAVWECADGNNDRMTTDLIRLTAGSTWATATWRTQRVIDGSSYMTYIDHGNARLAFGVANSEEAALTINGLGVHIAAPLARLHVGDDTARQLILSSSSDPTNKQMRLGYNTGNNTVVVEGFLGGAGVSLLLNPTGGNVGIGGTPAAKFHVIGPSADPSLSADTEAVYFSFASSIGLGFGSYPASPYSAWMQTKRSTNGGTADYLVINPLGGFVGINLTTPRAVLHVAGNSAVPTLNTDTAAVYYHFSTSVGIGFGSYPTTPWSAWIQTKRIDNSGAADALVLQPVGGLVGVGLAGPVSKLHVSGAGTPHSTVFDPGANTLNTLAISDTSGAVDGGGGLLLGSVTNLYCGIRGRFADGTGYGMGTMCFFVRRATSTPWLEKVLELLPNGGIAIPSLPSANPGAGSRQLWVDTADGNRVKFAA